jgi:hypothetical protein
MRVLALAAATLFVGCSGTTGGGLLTFTGLAGGPADAADPVTFTNGLGYQVTLTAARLHMGAVYLNASVPSSGAGESSCVLPGIYVAEVFGPIDIDLLSRALVAFPSPGEGIESEARAGEIWLTDGDVNARDDHTEILSLAGTAEKDGASWPFTASVTIGQNRALPVQNPALPGSNPICHQRIVTPIPIDLRPVDGGLLTLRVNPRGLLTAVDFSKTEKISDSPLLYQIPDEQGGVGGVLFNGLFANSGVYGFSFDASP